MHCNGWHDGKCPVQPSTDRWLAVLLLALIAAGVGYFVVRDYQDRQPVDPAVKAAEAIQRARRLQKIDEFDRTGVWPSDFK
jgi:hypothetical protein